MTNKMTKRDWLGEISKVVEASTAENKEGMLEFINHEIELLNRKSEKSGETKRDKENAKILEQIRVALHAVNKPVTITELQAASATMAQYSNQKLSALLRKLTLYGEVVKTIEKKKSYFSLAE